jgi:predicted permease
MITSTRSSDIERELASHVSNHIDDNIRLGMSREEARRDAMIRLGGVEQTRERYRDRAGIASLDSLTQDVAHAVRLVGRYPWFSAAVVLILSTGIAGVTTIVSFTNDVFAYGPPVDLARRVIVWSVAPDGRDRQAEAAARDFLAWSERATSIEQFVATRRTSATLTNGERLVPVTVAGATSGLFDVLGVKLARGRAFTERDARPGASAVAIVSSALWRAQFDSHADIVGRKVLLDGVPTGIIGVATPEYSASVDVIVPMVPDTVPAAIAQRTLTVSAVLRPGVTVPQAQSELATIAAELQREFPETNTGWTTNVRPYIESMGNPQARTSLKALAATSVLVLLVACANVANLLFARGVGRRREVAVRVALGVKRSRLYRQFLVEGLALSTLSASAGTVFAFAAISWLRSVLPGMFPPEMLDRLAIDPTVLLLATVGNVLVCVAVPAWQAFKLDTSAALHERASHVGGVRRQRTRKLSLAAQALVATMLITGSAVGLVAAVKISEQAETGFSARGVMTGDIVVPPDRYSDTAIGPLVHAVQERLSGIPGVELASATSRLPSARRAATRQPLTIAGRDATRDPAWAFDVTVTPEYFKTLRIPLRAGRDFDARDGAAAPLTVIVSQAAADRYWPGRSPLGAQVRIGDEDDRMAWRTVVGIVADIRNDDIVWPPPPPLPHIYLPLAQHPVRTVTLAVRSRNGMPVSPHLFASAVTSVDPNQPVYSMRSLHDLLDTLLAGVRVPLQLFGSFGLVAVLLVAGGIYSLTAYSVAQRRPEIALRMALGASRPAVVALVTTSGLLPAVFGMAFGLLVAIIGVRLMTPQYQFMAASPATKALIYGGPALLMAVVAVVSAFEPTLRATRVEPLGALSGE